VVARGKYVLSRFGPLGENCAFLVDGYVAGGTAITVARRNFPEQFLHYHRAGHGAVASPQTQRGYTTFVDTKISRVIGASSIHVGTMSFGKLEDDASCGSFLGRKQLIKNGKHALVAYIMKPKAGYDYPTTTAHFAAESSTGTNVNVCTTDDFTKSVDALVYYIEPENEEMKIAYPTMLFDRNITDRPAMMCNVLTLSIGNNQGMGDVDGKIYDIYFPPAYLRLFDGPSCNILDMWRVLDRSLAWWPRRWHDHQAEFRFAAKAFRRGVLRLLAGKRFHQER
jgi:ribulose 1,5-bisphosphate carboxylase large subunit-like protein